MSHELSAAEKAQQLAASLFSENAALKTRIAEMERSCIGCALRKSEKLEPK